MKKLFKTLEQKDNLNKTKKPIRYSRHKNTQGHSFPCEPS